MLCTNDQNTKPLNRSILSALKLCRLINLSMLECPLSLPRITPHLHLAVRNLLLCYEAFDLTVLAPNKCIFQTVLHIIHREKNGTFQLLQKISTVVSKYCHFKQLSYSIYIAGPIIMCSTFVNSVIISLIGYYIFCV